MVSALSVGSLRQAHGEWQTISKSSTDIFKKAIITSAFIFIGTIDHIA